MKTYGEKGSGLSMVGCECTCLFYWSSSLNKVTKKYINPSLDFNKQKCKDYKDVQTMDEAETRYHAIQSWWLPSGAPTKRSIFGLS